MLSICHVPFRTKRFSVMRINGWKLLVVCHNPDRFSGHGFYYLTAFLKGYMLLWVEAPHNKSPPSHTCYSIV